MPRLKHKDSGVTVSVDDDHPYTTSGVWEKAGKSSEPQKADGVEDDKTLPAREDQQPPEAFLPAEDPVDVSVDEQPNDDDGKKASGRAAKKSAAKPSASK